jgi:GntR family transcriptional regulator, arabinose operon transcriptional repressor
MHNENTNRNRPLYSQIIDHLKKRIATGELLPNRQIPTEKALAQQFNVSRITSKRALEELEREGLIYRKKGSGSFVKEKVKSDAVVSVIANQTPINVIALVMPFGSSMGRSMDVIQGLTGLLNKYGYYLTVHISNESMGEEKRIINNLVHDGVRGIILYPVSHDRNIDLIYRLSIKRYPIVTIDKYFDAFDVSCVVSDNFTGSYNLTAYLIEMGHREIVFFTDWSIESATSIRDRYFAFSKALHDHSIELDDSKLICLETMHMEAGDASVGNYTFSNHRPELIRKTLADLTNRPNKCTAIQAVNDMAAADLIRAALEMGIKVPEDLAIVGFDNLEKSEYLEVPLTTVDQDLATIGEEAGKLILDRINNPAGKSKKIIVPVKLIKRKSTEVDVMLEEAYWDRSM